MEHPHIHHNETILHQTIAHIESRLTEMGYNGDCAYERALEHSYRDLLANYGRKLFLLQSRRFLLSETPAIIAQAEAK